MVLETNLETEGSDMDKWMKVKMIKKVNLKRRHKEARAPMSMDK